MSKIEFKAEYVDHILSIILGDINSLKKKGIDDSRIAISIPSTIKNHIEVYKEKMDSKIEISKKFYGVDVVEGYNNQICVFDKLAEIDDVFCEPIELILNNE